MKLQAKLVSLLLALALVFSLWVPAAADHVNTDWPYAIQVTDGKTITDRFDWDWQSLYYKFTAGAKDKFLPLGASTVLKVLFTPENATTRTILWLSSDESAVSVTRTGLVTALAVGEATVTATSVDGECTASIKINVSANPSKGDINGDGLIDAADAMLALRNAVGLVQLTESQQEAGDVNGDGVVDAGDAVRILRYDAGLIDSVS